MRVVSSRRLTGGITAAVHRLTVEHVPSGRRQSVVLRQYEQCDAVPRETSMLRQAADAGLPAPRPLAASPAGTEAGGYPSVLLEYLPGRVDLSPADPSRWLHQMADSAARIHDAAVAAAPPFDICLDPERFTVPSASSRPELWRTLAQVLSAPESTRDVRFIHGDFQHFNMLWSRGRLTGVVDWGSAASGPPDIDAGHCRLNLAVLFGADWAERFRLAYEARAGRRVDPWWDLFAIASYHDSWQWFIPVQVDGRAQVDVAGMTGRVEELVQATLRRL